MYIHLRPCVLDATTSKRAFSFTCCLWNDKGDLEVPSYTRGRIASRKLKQTDLFELVAEKTGKHDKESFVVNFVLLYLIRYPCKGRLLSPAGL